MCEQAGKNTLYSTSHRNADEWWRTGGNQISTCTSHFLGRDCSVGTAIHYGMDGPGIETRWGEGFRSPPDLPLGQPSLLYNGYRVSFPGVKRPGRGVDHPPNLTPNLKKE